MNDEQLQKEKEMLEEEDEKYREFNHV